MVDFTQTIRAMVSGGVKRVQCVNRGTRLYGTVMVTGIQNAHAAHTELLMKR